MDEKSGEREKIKTLAVIVVIAVVADIKMEIFMKKFICAVSIMTGVLLLPLYAQAKVDITEIDVTDEVVSEDTIYELNKQYREETIGNKAIRFLEQHGIRIFGNVREPMVIKDGYADWDCKFSEELRMSGAAFGPIRLKYRFTGEEIVLSEEKEKLEDILESAEKRIFDIVQKRSSGDFVPIKDVVLRALDRIEAASRNKGSVTGIPTGFIDLDYKTTGMQPSDLVLIAAGFLGSQKYVTDAFKVATTARTNVETKPEAYETSVPRVFTAGDMHRGQSLVVWAIREGREAAKAVDESLMGYSYL